MEDQLLKFEEAEALMHAIGLHDFKRTVYLDMSGRGQETQFEGNIDRVAQLLGIEPMAEKLAMHYPFAIRGSSDQFYPFDDILLSLIDYINKGDKNETEN